MLVANSKTNFILSTNPENFEHGKRIRHQCVMRRSRTTAHEKG